MPRNLKVVILLSSTFIFTSPCSYAQPLNESNEQSTNLLFDSYDRAQTIERKKDDCYYRGINTVVYETLEQDSKSTLLDSDLYEVAHNNMRNSVINTRLKLDTLLPPNMDYQTLTVLRAPSSDSNKVVKFIANRLGFNSDDEGAQANLIQNIHNYRNKWNSLTKNPKNRMTFNDAVLAILASANSSNYGRKIYSQAELPEFNDDDFNQFVVTKKNNLNLLKQYDSLKRLAKDYINSYTNLKYRQSDIISKLNRVGRDQAKSDPIFRKQFDLLQKELINQYNLYYKYGTKLNQLMKDIYLMNNESN